MKKNVFCILLCFFALVTLSGAAEMEEYRGSEITVRYDSPLKNSAVRIASDYQKIRTNVETKLGLRLLVDPLVVLVRDNSSFQEMVDNKLVTAFAMPEKNLIVMDYSMVNKTPFDLEDTLKHELTHILLHQRISPPSLPKWLDEGVAQWASGGIADIMRTGEKELLPQAVLSHHLIPLEDIGTTFPGSPDGFVLAYEESRSFTEFIINQYGVAKFRPFLKSLEKQETVEQALYENYGVSLNTLQRSWKENLSRENVWISYAAEHMSWVLFLLAAFITIAGYCVVKRRINNYRDDDDDFEGGTNS